MTTLPVRSSKTGVLLGLIGLLVLVAIIILIYVLGNQARQRWLQNQAQQFQAPTVAVKQQVKKITLKRTTGTGTDTIEITENGKIFHYGTDGSLIKSGTQGFGTMRGLFEIVEKYLKNGQNIYIPQGYQLIIETNQGTIILDESTNPTNPGDGSIVDDIIEIIDPILNPTPRPSPLPSQVPTPSPFPSGSPAPTPSASPDLPPDYTAAPPFDCSDYYNSGKRLKISNIYCGLDEVNPQE